MDRRKAIKNMGIGVAATLYSSSVLSLLQSCKNDAANGVAWTREFFDQNQAVVVEQVLDVILPKTDTPGAVELGLPQFFDKYFKQVADKDGQDGFKTNYSKFVKQLESNSGKKLNKVTAEDYQNLIAKNLDSADQRDEAYDFISQARGLGIWAWKNSEQVGEEVYWYDPVPGKWIGCRPLDADGGGRLPSQDT